MLSWFCCHSSLMASNSTRVPLLLFSWHQVLWMYPARWYGVLPCGGRGGRQKRGEVHQQKRQKYDKYVEVKKKRKQLEMWSMWGGKLICVWGERSKVTDSSAICGFESRFLSRALKGGTAFRKEIRGVCFLDSSPTAHRQQKKMTRIVLRLNVSLCFSCAGWRLLNAFIVGVVSSAAEWRHAHWRRWKPSILWFLSTDNPGISPIGFGLLTGFNFAFPFRNNDVAADASLVWQGCTRHKCLHTVPCLSQGGGRKRESGSLFV